MIDYGDLELAVVARITPYLTDSLCVPMPETQAEFDRNVGKSKVSVLYRDSTFDPPKHMGGVSQKECMIFDVVIRAKKLRGPDSIYSISKVLRGVLLGYKLPDCFEITFQENGRAMSEEDFKAGVWTHTLVCKCETWAIEVEDVVVDPLITQITTLDDAGGLVVP